MTPPHEPGRCRTHRPACPSPRPPAPRGMPLRGPELRRQIIAKGPAFLYPEKFSPEESFQALLAVLVTYGLGSRTAEALVRERAAMDPEWRTPPREDALEVAARLVECRAYLPHILGNR